MNAKLFYLSHAQGCYDGLELADCGVSFKKIAFINMPFDENFNITIEKLKRIPDTSIVVIFSEKDCSCKNASLLKNKGLEYIDVIKSRDIYHSCKIAIDKFKELE